MEEFPELRVSRCSSLASFAARSSFIALSAQIWRACSPTSTINSSRDISSGAGTPRSNYDRNPQRVINTPRSPSQL
jgi:hypothetical protein